MAMAMTSFPADHPERLRLADEVHARPPEALDTPARASYLAVLVAPEAREAELKHLQLLCRRHGVAAPADEATHFRTELGGVRLKWERHGEFSGYTVIRAGAGPRPFEEPAADALPAGWLAELPGATIAAVHVELLRGDVPEPAALAAHFGGHGVVGADIAERAASAFTDFRIHDDGYARFLVVDRGLTPGQCGRTLQRLAEIEAYRTLALLALPIARRQNPRIVEIEDALARLTDGIALGQGDDEALLHELTRLAAEIESGLAASQFRFGACRAYDELVRRRIAELRESRLPGLQTIEEFMSRRFVPAVATCATVSQRLHDLSERVAQASNLLSTRVDIARQRQNQALLASMERRARQQLRLQQTVEGLSVAAITYYATSLIGYIAKGLKAGGLPLDPDLAVGVAIPLVALAVMAALRRARRRIAASENRAPSEH